MKAVATTIVIIALIFIGASFYLMTHIDQSLSNPRYPNQQDTSQQNSQSNFPTQFSNIPSCGTSKMFFSFPPVTLDKIVDLAPLGQLSPPDHVFPAPHNYFYVIDYEHPQDVNAPVYAPGNMTLTQIGLRHYNTLGQKTDYIDYTLFFSVCDKFDFYYHHVTTLTYQPFIDVAQDILKKCNFSKDRNEDFCSGAVNIPVKAGEQIGTTGDLKAGVYGLDMGARDYRLSTGRNAFVNPDKICGIGKNPYSHCYTVCAFDYFTDDIKRQLKFSTNIGTIVRTEEPVCGSVYYDVKDTAQGIWFGPNVATTFSPESNNLFLGPDNVQPSVKVFSVGMSISSLPAGKYEFNPTNSGLVNRDFRNVTSDGKIYCYETSQQAVIILQLTTLTTLKIERQNISNCGVGPWSFTSSATDFTR